MSNERVVNEVSDSTNKCEIATNMENGQSINDFSKAEVRDLDYRRVIIRQEDVLGFEIPVRDSQIMDILWRQRREAGLVLGDRRYIPRAHHRSDMLSTERLAPLS